MHICGLLYISVCHKDNLQSNNADICIMLKREIVSICLMQTLVHILVLEEKLNEDASRQCSMKPLHQGNLKSNLSLVVLYF